MLERLSAFFLSNEKLTTVLIAVIVVLGIGSYVFLPKQYNPSIVAPAFAISVPVPGYSSDEARRSVAATLEDALKGLPRVDKLYSTSSDARVSVMVSFEVGVTQEAAKTSLYDRLASRWTARPVGVQDFAIRSIDPEDLPQLSIALVSTATGLDDEQNGRLLRTSATTLRDAIRRVESTSVIDLIGGYPGDFHIVLDPEKIDAVGLDLASVVKKIRSGASRMSVGSADATNGRIDIRVDGTASGMDALKNLVLAGTSGNRVLLRDVAAFRFSPSDPDAFYLFADGRGKTSAISNAVFLGVAKQKGANAVNVVDRTLAQIRATEKLLPKDVRVVTIQNEGETARSATNELLFHLFVSIGIVVAVLVVFLGWRNALNAAFCIPLVLAIVFAVAIILGFDINRITLFALILSLGILVDDSIVMVENNARHLADAARLGKTKTEALLDSVREVGPSVLFSTVTRIMSFVAMFAVTGMMGDYMKPIPIFASIALVASLFVAFSVNPFLASKFYREESGHAHGKEGKILRMYGTLIGRFVGVSRADRAKRKRLRLAFWGALGLVLVLPIVFDVFRARMLPKADKDQAYLWVDLPWNATATATRDAANIVIKTLLGSGAPLPKDLAIVSNVSVGVGAPFLDDFANLFRGGAFRMGENQLSARIDLSPERTIPSERYVIRIRPILRDAILARYPDAKIRLLEDPPGPPTMATFEARLKGDIDTDAPSLVRFAEAVEKEVRAMAPAEGIVDLVDSVPSPRLRTVVRLRDDLANDRGVSAERVAETLRAAYAATPIAPLYGSDAISYESRDIVVELPKTKTGNESFLKTFSLRNDRWERVRLDEIATVSTEPIGGDISAENRTPTVTLSAEIGDNSVVYPVLALYGRLGSDDFARAWYRRIGATPYSMTFVGIRDGRTYRLEWGGEWEITMDTFRDLGAAMILSLLGIYFLIVAQFRSFRTGGLVMTTFLLSFFGIFPGFGILYPVSGEYFTATAMIGAIALGGIVVGNAIILLDYIEQLLREWKPPHEAIVEGAKKRLVPVLLTSLAAVLGSLVITTDPVWSGLAWSIIWGLSASAVLTLFFIPVFYSDHILPRPVTHE